MSWKRELGNGTHLADKKRRGHVEDSSSMWVGRVLTKIGLVGKGGEYLARDK